jgi:hypothetical protein
MALLFTTASDLAFYPLELADVLRSNHAQSRWWIERTGCQELILGQFRANSQFETNAQFEKQKY